MSTFITVDDAKIMRLRLKSIIEESGHQVIGEAANGKEAVLQFQEKKPDCVTLDISMPEQNGLAALQQILTVDQEAKVIIVSAVGQKQLVIQAMGIGAKDFIVKPFEAADIKKAIKKVLG